MLRSAHERDGGDEWPAALRSHDLLCPEPVLNGHDRRFGESATKRCRRARDSRPLRRDDAEIELRELARLGNRRDARGEVVAPTHPQAVLVQRLRVIVPPREHRDVRHLGQMRGEQTSDRTGTDDADLHANFARRYSRYGTGSISEPVTRRRSSGGEYRLPWR